MIDLHSHVLPGIDDGPRSLEGSLEMLRDARADGITRLAATPHVRADWPTTPDTMERLVAALREHDTGVEVLPGGELDLAYLETLADDDLRRFGLGGNPRLLLVEFPYTGWPMRLRDVLFRLGVRGFRVVLAHPERNREVQEQPERLREIVDAGIFVQLTAASVDGRLGRGPATAARTLLRERLAHLLASDAHAPSIRAIGMSNAAAAVGDGALARWLTHDVPEALVAGGEPPRRPATRRRGFFRR